ncbi:unnamed protein product, partial [Pylaiella littoralis]
AGGVRRADGEGLEALGSPRRTVGHRHRRPDDVQPSRGQHEHGRESTCVAVPPATAILMSAKTQPPTEPECISTSGQTVRRPRSRARALCSPGG